MHTSIPSCTYIVDSALHVGMDLFIYRWLLWVQYEGKEESKSKKETGRYNWGMKWTWKVRCKRENVWRIFGTSLPASLSATHAVMLAGVFLYKRPILWDAQTAMQGFDGQHTKAQRQRGRLWYLYQSPTASLASWYSHWYSPASSAAHTDSTVENPPAPGTNSHKFTHIYQTLHTYSMCTPTCILHARVPRHKYCNLFALIS